MVALGPSCPMVAHRASLTALRNAASAICTQRELRCCVRHGHGGRCRASHQSAPSGSNRHRARRTTEPHLPRLRAWALLRRRPEPDAPASRRRPRNLHQLGHQGPRPQDVRSQPRCKGSRRWCMSEYEPCQRHSTTTGSHHTANIGLSSLMGREKFCRIVGFRVNRPSGAVAPMQWGRTLRRALHLARWSGISEPGRARVCPLFIKASAAKARISVTAAICQDDAGGTMTAKGPTAPSPLAVLPIS